MQNLPKVSLLFKFAQSASASADEFKIIAQSGLSKMGYHTNELTETTSTVEKDIEPPYYHYLIAPMIHRALAPIFAEIHLDNLVLPDPLWHKYRRHNGLNPHRTNDGCEWWYWREQQSVYIRIQTERNNVSEEVRILRGHAKLMTDLDRVTRMIPGAVQPPQAANFYRALTEIGCVL